jgi:hypothetical protein
LTTMRKLTFATFGGAVFAINRWNRLAGGG